MKLALEQRQPHRARSPSVAMQPLERDLLAATGVVRKPDPCHAAGPEVRQQFEATENEMCADASAPA
jgi:hypothetical protein